MKRLIQEQLAEVGTDVSDIKDFFESVADDSGTCYICCRHILRFVYVGIYLD